MLKRLYFLFPAKHQVERAVEELLATGIKPGNLHTIARDGVDLSGLPPVTERQKDLWGMQLERTLWNYNLVIFFVALATLVVSILLGSWAWSIAMLAIMAVTFLAGNYLAVHLPHAHIDDFQAALSHNEILLLVDAPRWRIQEVESVIREHHPEANIDGVGWSLESLQV